MQMLHHGLIFQLLLLYQLKAHGHQLRDQNNQLAFDTLVYQFDPKSGQWNRPIIKGGKEPIRRREYQAVVGDESIYMFGGAVDNLVGSDTVQFLNDLIIFNTNDLTWSEGSTLNTPIPRWDYTATILSDGRIIYIGGIEHTVDDIYREVDINQINIYDTKSASWSVMVCTGHVYNDDHDFPNWNVNYFIEST
jgi:N-acetylneuraminic acid mutarotase